MNKQNLLFTVILTLSFYTTIMGQTVPSYVPTDSLISWWSFNGNANDESGNGHNGIVNGPILTTDRFGVSNQAYSFNFNQSIIVPHDNQLNISSDFSISLWYNANTNYFVQDLIIKGMDASVGSYWIRHHDYSYITPYLDFACNLGAGFVHNEMLTPPLNVWHFIVGVVSDSTMKLYYDGELMDSSTSVQNLNTVTNDSNLIIGTFQYSFSGKIDDIGIWNRALTTCEINELYQSSTSSITVGANSTSNEICAGDSVILTGFGTAEDYFWSNGVTDGVSFPPIETTLYTVTGTDSNGCTSSATITVNVNSLPMISTTSIDTFFCVDATETPLFGSPTGGSWSGSGIVLNSFDPSLAGVGLHNLVYLYTDSNNCTNSDTLNILVDACVGANEISHQDLFMVYPNPATNQINIHVNTILIGSTYTIKDQLDRMVLLGKLNMENSIIELGTLSEGIYVFNIEGNAKQIFKIIKK